MRCSWALHEVCWWCRYKIGEFHHWRLKTTSYMSQPVIRQIVGFFSSRCNCVLSSARHVSQDSGEGTHNTNLRRRKYCNVPFSFVWGAKLWNVVKYHLNVLNAVYTKPDPMKAFHKGIVHRTQCWSLGDRRYGWYTRYSKNWIYGEATPAPHFVRYKHTWNKRLSKFEKRVLNRNDISYLLCK